MLNIEHAIREVAAVYRALTGRAIEESGAELPPTGNPAAHVEQRYLSLRGLLDDAPAGRGAGVWPQAAPPPGTALWAPPVDITEVDGEVRCDIDLPAVGRDQVTVSLQGDCLVVRGERPLPALPAVIRRAERPAGPFQKVLALPPRARRDGIAAVLRDGVLSVTVPLDGHAGAAETALIEVR